LREWESVAKNCDLLEIYDPLYIPNLQLFPKPNSHVVGSSEFKSEFDDGVEFTALDMDIDIDAI
jgi:hypothetical protein